MGVLAYFERQKSISYSKIMSEIWKDKVLQNTIIQLNTKAQLFGRGIDSLGETLVDYSAASVDLFGKREGHIQLFDEGDFYKSFKIIPLGEDADIYADTIKIQDNGKRIDLTDRFGIEIIGLTNESKQILKDIMSSILQEKLRQFLQVN